MRIEAEIKLYIHGALLGNIGEDLIGVRFYVEDGVIEIISYYLSEIDEDEQEEISVMETEIIAAFFPEYKVNWIYKICSEKGLKKEFELFGNWIFLRRL